MMQIQSYKKVMDTLASTLSQTQCLTIFDLSRAESGQILRHDEPLGNPKRESCQFRTIVSSRKNPTILGVEMVGETNFGAKARSQICCYYA